MRGSSNFRQKGGGGPRHSDKKSSDSVVFFFFFFCFFLSPQLILQKSNGQFQRRISFFKVPEGVQFFPGGGGGWGSNFFHVCGPLSPPSGSAFGCDLFSFPVRKMMRPPLAPVLVFLQLRSMFSVEPHNKIVS